jgi:truncated hemoglobin YjbI
MKNEFAKWLKEMQDALNSKADNDALINLERLFMERLNEIVKALTKQLADKNDTKKALKLLER